MAKIDGEIIAAEIAADFAFQDTVGQTGDALMQGIARSFVAAEEARLAKLPKVREKVIPNLPTCLQEGIQREMQRTGFGDSHLVTLAGMAQDAIDICRIIQDDFEARLEWNSAVPVWQGDPLEPDQFSVAKRWESEGKLRIREPEQLGMGITGKNVQAYLAELGG